MPLYQKHEHEPNVYYMEKTRYSAFAGTDLELKLRERQIGELHLAGVCTDICDLFLPCLLYYAEEKDGFRGDIDPLQHENLLLIRRNHRL